jgi:hypothetical protein
VQVSLPVPRPIVRKWPLGIVSLAGAFDIGDKVLIKIVVLCASIADFYEETGLKALPPAPRQRMQLDIARDFTRIRK